MREYIGPHGTYLHQITKKVAGKNMELVASKMLYDPKYGMPDRIEEFTREHCAALEDMTARSPQHDQTGAALYRIVALIDQRYAD